MDTDQKLAQFQPSQKQQHKSSHQGKLSSLRDVPWPHSLSPHYYLHYSSTWRLCRDQGPSVLSTLQTQSKTLFLTRGAGAHNSRFTLWWSDLLGATQRAYSRAEGRALNPSQCLAPVLLASPSEKEHLWRSAAHTGVKGSDWAFLKVGWSQQPEPHWDSRAAGAGVLTLLLQALVPHIGSLQPPKQMLSPFFPDSSNTWKLGQICYHMLLPTSEKQQAHDHLAQTVLQLQERFSALLLHLNTTLKSGKIINWGLYPPFHSMAVESKGYTTTPPGSSEENKAGGYPPFPPTLPSFPFTAPYRNWTSGSFHYLLTPCQQGCSLQTQGICDLRQRLEDRWVALSANAALAVTRTLYTICHPLKTWGWSSCTWLHCRKWEFGLWVPPWHTAALHSESPFSCPCLPNL